MTFKHIFSNFNDLITLRKCLKLHEDGNENPEEGTFLKSQTIKFHDFFYDFLSIFESFITLNVLTLANSITFFIGFLKTYNTICAV